MKDFAPYVDGLAALVERSTDGRRTLNKIDVVPALDGQPSEALRKLISLEKRRRDGVFFTGSQLAEKVASQLKGQLSESSVVTDPACGGGDLLLASARHLPQAVGLWETLNLWGKNLQGTDIHAEFVRSTKLRLVLQALVLGTDRSRISQEQVATMFPKIRVFNGLADDIQLRTSTHVVTNPPYSMVATPDGCDWTTGRVNFAAVFIDFITRSVEPGARVLAVLPDVLRSGSRYVKWRALINSRLSNLRVNIFGQFSPHADVDVFMLSGKRRKPTTPLRAATSFSMINLATDVPKVGDKFIVHVGPVVPHRHKKTGKEYPFVTPHNCPPWECIHAIRTRRRFNGTVFRPPFVAIRRTSRSDDRHRAIATVITGDEETAVENHIIVAIPRSGGLNECHELLRVLKSPTTSSWLNLRMCCRHLTISSVITIPWIMEAP